MKIMFYLYDKFKIENDEDDKAVLFVLPLVLRRFCPKLRKFFCVRADGQQLQLEPIALVNVFLLRKMGWTAIVPTRPLDQIKELIG